MKIDVRYQVADGYAGGARPQRMKFDMYGFGDDADAGDIYEAVMEAVEEDYRNRIYWTLLNESEIRSAIDTFIANRNPED